MERKEFLSLVGITASSFVMGCIGCSKNNSIGSSVGPSNVDFTLDLSQSANAALNSNGSFLYKNDIIIARTLNGDFIAVQQICTHQNFSVTYQAGSHRFYCGGHGGTFSETGQVTGGPPPAPLTKYNTALTGNMLRIYS
jgi:Rieske Fe-S protein